MERQESHHPEEPGRGAILCRDDVVRRHVGQRCIGALEAQTLSIERLTLAAQRITATLRRIADGTYGRCQECDDLIPPARLKAIPTATLCVPCQSAAERRADRAVRTPQSADEEAPHV